LRTKVAAGSKPPCEYVLRVREACKITVLQHLRRAHLVCGQVGGRAHARGPRRRPTFAAHGGGPRSRPTAAAHARGQREYISAHAVRLSQSVPINGTVRFAVRTRLPRLVRLLHALVPLRRGGCLSLCREDSL
jgi:hypothetical protein